MRSSQCVRTLFISVWGRGWGGTASLCRALVSILAKGMIFDMRKDGVVVYVFSVF